MVGMDHHGKEMKELEEEGEEERTAAVVLLCLHY
jgi:hypothetical protein